MCDCASISYIIGNGIYKEICVEVAVMNPNSGGLYIWHNDTGYEKLNRELIQSRAIATFS